jgi:outer membrane protein assembly factor BamD
MPIKADLDPGTPAKSALILILLAWALTGCGGSFGGDDTGLVGDLAKGERAYNKGHYQEAILNLQRFRETQPGSRFMDKALFLLGKSHQGTREFLLAADAFSQVLTDYPTSPYAEEAAFELAMSAFRRSKGADWTQEATEEAIRGFRQYLIAYADGEFVAASEDALNTLEGRLAMKACKTGELYLKLRQDQGAKYYFEKGLGYRSDVEAVPRCYLGLAKTLERLGDIPGALDAYRSLEAWLADHGESVLKEGKRTELLESARSGIQSLDRLDRESTSSFPLSGGDEP